MYDIATNLPKGTGLYRVSMVITDRPDAGSHVHTIIAEGIAGIAFDVTTDEDDDGSLMASVRNGAVVTDAASICDYAERILDAGSRTACVHLDLTPDGQRNVVVIAGRNSMGASHPIRIVRYPTSREQAGAAALTAEQLALRTVERTAARPPHEAVAVDDAAAYADVLRGALRRDLSIDAGTRHVRQLVDDSITDGIVDVVRLSSTMAGDLNMTMAAAEMFVRGAARRGGTPLPEFEKCMALRQELGTLTGTSGVFAANAGFQRLIADLSATIEETKPPATQAQAAFALAGLVDIANELMGKAVAEGDQLSEEFQFATAVRRALVKGDAHAIGDAYAQAPRRIAAQLVGFIADDVKYNWIVDEMSQQRTVFPTQLAATLANEPDFDTGQLWNYGPRWRRLDSPDHALIARRLGIDMLRGAWIRTADNTDDADAAMFDPDGAMTLPGDDHDNSDVMWMIGVGPDVEHVAPVYAAMLERSFVVPGRIAYRHTPVEFAPGPLQDGAREALAIALNSQLNDDLQWQINLHGRVELSITTDDPVPKGKEEAAKLLSYRFIDYALQSVGHINEVLGPVVTMVKEGRDVTHRVTAAMKTGPGDRMTAYQSRERYEPVELQAVIGADAWGALAVMDPSGVRFIRVEEMDDEPIFRATLDRWAKASPDELNVRLQGAGEEAADLADGMDPEGGSVEAAMHLQGRAMLVVLARRGGDPIGISFARIMPGMDAASTLQALIERHRSGEALQHGFDVAEGTGEDDFDFGNNDLEDMLAELGTLIDGSSGGDAEGFDARDPCAVREADLVAAGAPAALAKALAHPGDPEWWKPFPDAGINAPRAIGIMYVDMVGGSTQCRRAAVRLGNLLGKDMTNGRENETGITIRLGIETTLNRETLLQAAEDAVDRDGCYAFSIAWLDDCDVLMAHRPSDGQAVLHVLEPSDD